MLDDQNERTETVAKGPDELSTLTPNQEKALQALLAHPTLKEAARAAGLSEVTLYRYMQNSEFARRLGEARRETFSHAVAGLQQLAGEAVVVLGELMRKEDAPASARLSAIRTVFEYAIRAGEVEDLRAQVEELRQLSRQREDEKIILSGLAGRGGNS